MKMRQMLIVMLLGVGMVIPVSATDWTEVQVPYQYDAVFDSTGSNPHGILVDKYNRIWIGTYYDQLYIKNPDGTDALAPIDSFTVTHPAGGDTTIPAKYCRGLNLDQDGNILFAKWGSIIKIDVDTGEPLDWVPFPALGDEGSPLRPAVDASGYIYVGMVVGVSPVYVIDPSTFEIVQQITLDPTAGYARGMEVSSDGLTLYACDLTDGPHPVYIYTSSDYINYNLTDSLWTDVDGDTIFTTQTVTVNWGPNGKLWYSQDNSYGAGGSDQLDNALIVFDFATSEYGYLSMPDPGASGFTGPRGCAFSATGDTIYVASWNAGVVYRYVSTEIGIVDGNDARIPTTYRLFQNYPNPFNPRTTIPFEISASGDVKLIVYDMLGRRVLTLIDKPMVSGHYEVPFDATELATGVYVYRLTVTNQSEAKRMIYVK